MDSAISIVSLSPITSSYARHAVQRSQPTTQVSKPLVSRTPMPWYRHARRKVCRMRGHRPAGSTSPRSGGESVPSNLVLATGADRAGATQMRSAVLHVSSRTYKGIPSSESIVSTSRRSRVRASCHRCSDLAKNTAGDRHHVWRRGGCCRCSVISVGVFESIYL